MLRVAALQLRVTGSRIDNLTRAAALIDRAANEGASLVSLPEVFTGSYGVEHFASWQEDVPDHAAVAKLAWQTTLSGAEMMADCARRHSITVTGGIVERGEAGRLFNSMPIYGPDGARVDTYRKVHLSRVQGHTSESDVFAAGDAPCTFSIAAPPTDSHPAQRFDVGMACCFDLRFPAVLGGYGPHAADNSRRVDAICVPSAFLDFTGRDHWDVLLRRTALDQQAYVIAPGVCFHPDDPLPLHGRSAVCDPWGTIVAQCGAEGDDMAVAEMEAARLEEVRGRLRLAALRRTL